MPDPEEWISNFALKHSDPNYDPIAAREYYLRTRKLKGRRHGLTVQPSEKTSKALVPVRKKPVVKAKPTAEQRRKAQEVRVAQLNNRLKELRKVLAQLVKEAKLRSGVDPAKETAHKKELKAIADSKLTPAEKAKKAKDAKERYEKSKKTSAAQSTDEKAIQAKIDAVQEKISQMRAQLAAAKEANDNRSSSSVGVRAKPNQVERNSQNGS